LEGNVLGTVSGKEKVGILKVPKQVFPKLDGY